MPKAPRAETHAQPPTFESTELVPGSIESVEVKGIEVSAPPPAEAQPTDTPKPPPDQPAAPSTRTPDEWAAAKGLFAKATAPWKSDNYDWRHAAAVAAHGWAEHAHHAGAPMQLSEADYDAAIAAVQTPSMTPHTPAVSPYSPHQKGA